jgi:Protein of unknown function (DUF763)
MTRLGAVVHHYGRDELLRRLAHPFWFQSFAAVMGMDWHSSGITTSVVGEWKRGLAYSRRRSEHVACDAAGELRQIGFAQFGFAHGLPLSLGLEVHAALRYTSGRRQGRGSRRQRGFSGDRQKQGRLCFSATTSGFFGGSRLPRARTAP